jgi:hypothetical protein
MQRTITEPPVMGCDCARQLTNQQFFFMSNVLRAGQRLLDRDYSGTRAAPGVG